MSKEHSDALFMLIKRMSKSEKRFFKLRASRSGGNKKKFVILFDRLERMKEHQAFVMLKAERSFDAKQLPNLKLFLYNYLLDCLRTCNTTDSIDLQLTELCSNVRILYDKCLYRDCIKMLDRAKKIALKYERSSRLLELLELEKLVIRQTVNVNHATRVEESVSKTQEVLSEIENVSQFENLSIRLNVFYVQTGFIRDRNDLVKVEQFFKKNLPPYKKSELNFLETLHLNFALAGYYFYIQDFKNGYRIAKDSVELFNENPEKIMHHTEFYIRALNSLLVVLNKLHDLEEFEVIHKELVALKRRSDLIHTENIKLNLFKAIYVHEINRHFLRGEFRSGTRIVGRLENELNKFVPLLDHNSLLLLYYKISCLYFGAGQYKSALVWLNRIILEKDISVREDLHVFARILELICHDELGNDRIAEAHIKSLYRFILKKAHASGGKKISVYNRLILAFIRKLHRNLSAKQMKVLFQDLKEKLLPLTSQRFEKRAFYYFDIISWLECKIEKRTVEEVIKSKIKRKISN